MPRAGPPFRCARFGAKGGARSRQARVSGIEREAPTDYEVRSNGSRRARMSEQPLDLRRVLEVVARGKWTVVVCVALGIGVATASTLASPPRYTANTLVLLSQSGTDAAGNPSRNIDTETEIASSAEVLAIASRNLDPAPSVDELEAAVSVVETTADILRITAVASSPSRAIAFANASADAYRDYKAVSATALMEEVVSQLQVRAEQLQQQITAVQAELMQAIATLATTETNSPAAVAQTSLIDSLRIQENEATTQLADAQNQITQAQLEANVNTAGITVLERSVSRIAWHHPRGRTQSRLWCDRRLPRWRNDRDRSC